MMRSSLAPPRLRVRVSRPALVVIRLALALESFHIAVFRLVLALESFHIAVFRRALTLESFRIAVVCLSRAFVRLSRAFAGSAFRSDSRTKRLSRLVLGLLRLVMELCCRSFALPWRTLTVRSVTIALTR